MNNAASVEERFWSFVRKSSPDECWDWQGGIKENGRGNFWYNGKTIQAHRMMWILVNGPIQDGLQILHHCDNGKCVNPGHLFLGTQADNMRDMMSKNRHPIYRGEDSYQAKLTTDQVLEIRRLADDHIYTQSKIADMYGVSRGAVLAIHLRYNWKHL